MATKPTDNTNDKVLPRSFRVSESIWELAKARAAQEGTTISGAAADLVEGYARGVYDLPRTRTTKQFPQG